MKNKIEIEEEIKIIDGKPCAVAKLDTKRELNGCEVRKNISTKLTDLIVRRQVLEKEIANINIEAANLECLDGKLKSLGYCKVDNPEYEKIGGLLKKDLKTGEPIIKGYTHQTNCLNRGK